jgi:outer membrane receptor for ferrienterochelin and colicin
VRIDHRDSEDSYGHVQLYSNYSRSNVPPWLLYQTWENDLEAEHHFRWNENHTATVGGNFRWTNIASDSKPEQFVYRDEPFNEYWAGVFGMDSWQISDRLTLEGQLRGDWYSETQTDWSSRVTALYAMDEQKRHILRFGGAKAFRAPLLTLRETELSRVALPSPPLPPDLWAVNMYPPDDLDNEETVSVEAGYTGRLNTYTTWRTDLYYQHYEKLIGYRYLDDPLGLNRYLITTDNIGGADAWGAENELALEGKPGKLSLWYAYNDVRRKHGEGQEIRAFLPATHKAGITGRVHLPWDFTLNVNYCFADETITGFGDNNNAPSVGATHHLDITVSREILNGAGEIMAGVSDVLKERRDPVYAEAQTASHETPGRMFFVRMQLKF